MQNFINRYGVQDGLPPTHTSLARPRARFAFESAQHTDQFYRRYIECLRNGDQLYVSELPRVAMPILVDIDLYVSADTVQPDQTLYELHHAQAVHQAMCQAMADELLDVGRDALVAVLLEKPPYVNDGRHKHGFHLHFGNAYIDRETCERLNVAYERHLRANVVFSELVAGLGMDIAAAVDVGAVLRNPWLMYGSSKGPGLQPYRATCALGPDAVVLPVDEALSVAVRSTRWPMGELVNIPADGSLTDLLPLLLSIHVHDRPLMSGKRITPAAPTRPAITVHTGTEAPRFQTTALRQYTDEDLDANIKAAAELVPMLAPRRAVPYSSWWTIGWLLHAVTGGRRAGYELFLSFSRTAGPGVFCEASCERLWTRAHPTSLNMGTLHHYARHDSPEAYATWRRNTTRVEFTAPDAFSTHYSVARLMHLLFSSVYKCASISQKIWYAFSKDGWKLVDEGTDLRAHISDHLLTRLRTIRDDTICAMRMIGRGEAPDVDDLLQMEGNDADDTDVRAKQLTAVLKRLAKSELDLQSTPFRNSVMVECMHMFYDAHFLSRLDRDPYLFVFANGIYDLSNCVFRDTTPDDYVSRVAPVEYDTGLSMDSPAVADVLQFLARIFPNPSVRQFFMDYYCDIFVGNNAHKYVMLWTGEGDNGKSMTQMLFEKMLGCYSVKLPTSLITGKRTQSSTACPELARAGNGVRLAMLQEPDKRDTINIGMLKELSGQDTIYARALYTQGQEITPMFKLALVCNEPPSLSYSDKATWNRLRVLPFVSTFMDSPPDDEAEQERLHRYPKDTTLVDRLEGMAAAFAWLLLHHRAHVRGPLGGIHEPDEVKLATQQLKVQLDCYAQFEGECTRVTDQFDDTVMLGRLYEEFKRWFRDSMPGHTLPNKPEVKQEFIRRWGQPDVDGNGWRYRRVYIFDPLNMPAHA